MLDGLCPLKSETIVKPSFAFVFEAEKSDNQVSLFRRGKGAIKTDWSAILQYERDTELLLPIKIESEGREDIAGLIKQTREKHGLTQDQFAELIKVEARTVRRWETGETYPQGVHIARIKAAIGQIEAPHKRKQDSEEDRLAQIQAGQKRTEEDTPQLPEKRNNGKNESIPALYLNENVESDKYILDTPAFGIEGCQKCPLYKEFGLANYVSGEGDVRSFEKSETLRHIRHRGRHLKAKRMS